MNRKRAISYLGIVLAGAFVSVFDMQTLMYGLVFVFLVEEVVRDD